MQIEYKPFGRVQVRFPSNKDLDKVHAEVICKALRNHPAVDFAAQFTDYDSLALVVALKNQAVDVKELIAVAVREVLWAVEETLEASRTAFAAAQTDDARDAPQ